MKLLLAALALAVLVTARAEVIHAGTCPSDMVAGCEVHEARVEPCTNPKECVLYVGHNATISFDFTPQFAASRLKVKAVWHGLPFSGMDTDGCHATACPTTPGQRQIASSSIYLHKKLPKGVKYTFQWQLYDEDNQNQAMCCFEVTVRLKAPKK